MSYSRRRRSSNGSRNQNRKRKYHRNHRRNFNKRGNRYKGENIPHHKYIAKADKSYVAPSIYADNSYFNQMNLNSHLKRNIEEKGYIHPTKIQNRAIPVILKGQDVLGLASTGSGKTGAFLIPIIENVLSGKTRRCLIIVPTRELAIQIDEELKGLTVGMRIYSAIAIGGKNIGSQIKKLRRDPQFVIGTPGRLKDLYERKALDLSKFDNIVLDEVDRMLDMGFLPDISFLISKLGEKRQTTFFSATMSEKAKKISKGLLINPDLIQIEKESPIKNVHQDIVVVNHQNKKEILAKLLMKDDFEKVLVFSRTKRGADKLSRKLKQNNIRVDSIHGNKRQNQRIRILNSFKNDELDVLIATDVAARGLDIPDVSHVINYDEPQTYQDYIHRIGRTGRIGKAGNALTFVE